MLKKFLGCLSKNEKIDEDINAAKKQMEMLIKNKECIKLHIGCGKNYFDGWINIDNNSDNNIEKLDLNYDLRNRLPIEDNSVDFIFNEHFIEHLSAEEGVQALREFRRILKPGGILRVATPDLENIIKQYLDPNWKEYNWIKEFGYEHLQTKAEMFNLNFYEWGHKHLYDKEELGRRVSQAGFNDFIFVERCKSSHPELNGLETRIESSLVVEAVK